MLTKFFDLAVIKRKLLFNKGATMVATSAAGVETVVDMTELAALGGVTASAAELNVTDGALDTNLVAAKAAILGTGGALTIGGAFTAVTSIGIGSAVLLEAEMEMLDQVTAGTLAAGKVWTSDSDLDTVMPTGGKLTVQSGGDVTFNSGSTHLVDTPTTSTVLAAEHGAGAIGTAVAPKTRRWVDRGVIVTQTTFDLTGLASGGTANDIVGLAAGGAAYIGRNVVATNGVIFKMELSCLETPVTGDVDIDIVADTSAALIGDGAYTGAIKINGGTLVIGQTVQNLVPAVNANFYFYIAAVGAGGGTYTAGMFVLTTYGHAVLA